MMAFLEKDDASWWGKQRTKRQESRGAPKSKPASPVACSNRAGSSSSSQQQQPASPSSPAGKSGAFSRLSTRSSNRGEPQTWASSTPIADAVRAGKGTERQTAERMVMSKPRSPPSSHRVKGAGKTLSPFKIDAKVVGAVAPPPDSTRTDRSATSHRTDRTAASGRSDVSRGISKAGSAEGGRVAKPASPEGKRGSPMSQRAAVSQRGVRTGSKLPRAGERRPQANMLPLDAPPMAPSTAIVLRGSEAAPSSQLFSERLDRVGGDVQVAWSVASGSYPERARRLDEHSMWGGSCVGSETTSQRVGYSNDMECFVDAKQSEQEGGHAFVERIQADAGKRSSCRFANQAWITSLRQCAAAPPPRALPAPRSLPLAEPCVLAPSRAPPSAF